MTKASKTPHLDKHLESRMPKKQPCLGEHSPCVTFCKNAKDKSNSTTLLAIRNTKGAQDSSGRGSRCSSEKDSGYSDGSDWQQTDVEDQRSNTGQSRCSEHAETSQPGQNQGLGQGNPGTPTLMSAVRGHPPIYVIKNIVLKQPDMIQKRDQLPLRNGSRQSGSSGAAHVIFLQQPSLLPACHQRHKPLLQKPSATEKTKNATCLPILNYPRIAPHPSKKPPDRSSSNDESQNLSKRVCTEHKSGDTPVTRSGPEQDLYKQPKLAILNSGLPCSFSTRDSRSCSSPTTVSSSQGSPSGSSLYTNSSFLATRRLLRNSATNSRHRRFLNTVEILNQSGLLDITLRTKELLRQSTTTSRDIAQLRQHTELLCRAASNPSCNLNGMTGWEHLHQAMAESGSYPNLEILQNVQIHPDSASQPECISTGGTNGPQDDNSEMLPSHLLTTKPYQNQDCPVPQQPCSGQGREVQASHKSSETVTFMPPDSSTD